MQPERLSLVLVRRRHTRVLRIHIIYTSGHGSVELQRGLTRCHDQETQTFRGRPSRVEQGRQAWSTDAAMVVYYSRIDVYVLHGWQVLMPLRLLSKKDVRESSPGMVV